MSTTEGTLRHTTQLASRKSAEDASTDQFIRSTRRRRASPLSDEEDAAWGSQSAANKRRLKKCRESKQGNLPYNFKKVSVTQSEVSVYLPFDVCMACFRDTPELRETDSAPRDGLSGPELSHLLCYRVSRMGGYPAGRKNLAYLPRQFLWMLRPRSARSSVRTRFPKSMCGGDLQPMPIWRVHRGYDCSDVLRLWICCLRCLSK